MRFPRKKKKNRVSFPFSSFFGGFFSVHSRYCLCVTDRLLIHSVLLLSVNGEGLSRDCSTASPLVAASENSSTKTGMCAKCWNSGTS